MVPTHRRQQLLTPCPNGRLIHCHNARPYRPSTAGNSTQKVLPLPTSVSAPISPPMPLISRLAMERPIPVPGTLLDSRPSRLKGSNKWDLFSSEMPWPVSAIVIRTTPSSRAAAHKTKRPPEGGRSVYHCAAEISRLVPTLRNSSKFLQRRIRANPSHAPSSLQRFPQNPSGSCLRRRLPGWWRP